MELALALLETEVLDDDATVEVVEDFEVSEEMARYPPAATMIIITTTIAIAVALLIARLTRGPSIPKSMIFG